MHIPEPPITADDTQPNRLKNTKPSRTGCILPTWMLFALIVLSGISLIATVSFMLRPDEIITTSPIQKSITLVVGGDVDEVDTQAATVADLLRDQNIEVASDDAISTSPDTLLVDGMTITINRARTVTLRINENIETIQTPFTNPYDILNNQDMVLNPLDEIWLDGTRADHDALETWPVPVNEIVIRPAFTVTIIDGETETVIETTADTVGDVLFEADVVVYITDYISPDISTVLNDDTQIVIDRARPVTIRVDGVNIETRVQGRSVLDALTEAGIALVGLDYTIPAENEPVAAGMTVYVLRVTENIVSTEEAISFETTYQADASLELDQRRTIQAGQEGIRRIDERVRYENGVEVGREPAGTEVTQTAQNQIVAYGTNIILRTVDTPQGTREYWRKLRVYATSYHPEALGGDNVTAIGATLEHGIIGANSTIIPYRTNMFVPGYGVGIMADTGGTRSSPYWIDLGYGDEDYRSWHQYVDVYLLTPIPENINYLLPTWRPMRGLPDN